MRVLTNVSRVRGWPALAAALLSTAPLSSGCLFFDGTVYCDTSADCPEAMYCELSLGECRAGSPKKDGGPPDGRSDAGNKDAGSDDAGPTDGGSDGGDLDAGPDIPTTPLIQILPEHPRTLDDLLVSFLEESEARGPVSYRYEWFLDNELQADLTSERVPAARTAKGQTWRVEVTPSAGDFVGDPAIQQTLILDTPPSLRGVALYPLRPTVGDTLHAIPIGYDDPDGDEPSFEYEWFEHTTGQTVQSGPDATLAAAALSFFAGRASVSVTVTPSGMSSGEHSVSTCPRLVWTTPTWEMEHPVGSDKELPLGGPYLHFDERHDRLVVGMVDAKNSGISLYELRLEAPERGWSLLDMDTSLVHTGAAQVWLPSLDGFLRFGGVDDEVGDEAVTADLALLDLQQGCETISPVPSSSSGPSARMGSTAQYDPTAERALVLFGANADPSFPNNEVWALSLDSSSHEWSPVSPDGIAPRPRTFSYSVYDPIEHQIVVYGGVAVSDGFFELLADAHALSLTENAEEWRPLPSADNDGPGARLFAGVAFHAPGHELVVIGGCDDFDAHRCVGSFHTDAYRLSLTPGQERWEGLPIQGPLIPGPILEMVADHTRGTYWLLALDEGDQTGSSRQLLKLTPGEGESPWELEKVWSQIDDVPSPRARFALVGPSGEYDDLLAVYGGHYMGGGSGEVALDDIWRFSLEEQRWTPMPQTGTPPSARHGFTWATGGPLESGPNPSGPFLLLSGGRCDDGSIVTTCGETFRLRRSDEPSLTWERWKPAVEDAPDRPANFEGVGLLRIAETDRVSMYTLGGRDSAGNLVADGYSFQFGHQFAEGTWQHQSEEAPLIASAAAAVSRSESGAFAYVFGGMRPGFPVSNTLDAAFASNVDPSDTAWELTSLVVQGSVPAPRMGATLTQVAPGSFILFGGEGTPDGPVPADLWLLQCDESGTTPSCSWSPVELPVGQPQPRPRAFHGAAYDPVRDRLYIFGGEVEGSPVNETWSIGPVSLITAPLMEP